MNRVLEIVITVGQPFEHLPHLSVLIYYVQKALTFTEHAWATGWMGSRIIQGEEYWTIFFCTGETGRALEIEMDARREAKEVNGMRDDNFSSFQIQANYGYDLVCSVLWCRPTLPIKNEAALLWTYFVCSQRRVPYLNMGLFQYVLLKDTELAFFELPFLFELNSIQGSSV